MRPPHPARTFQRSTTALAGAAGLVLGAGSAWANPEDGRVIAGQAVIERPGPGQVDIRQDSGRAVIDWQSFSIGPGEHTRFRQPGPEAITLNRVTGPNPSEIMGRLSANGQVWLVNPHGIFFGPTAQVDVGGLLATTHTIRADDFMAGRFAFEGQAGAAAMVENEGSITVRNAGLAAFVAPGVANRGTIDARLGSVELASGRAFVVDLYGDQKINLAVDAKTDAQPVGHGGKPAKALVENSGKIFADAGRVRLSAASARGIVDRVIDMSGHVQARSVREENGEIVLSGDDGTVEVSGTLDAAGRAAGETGGAVTVTGRAVAVRTGARIDTTGPAGGGPIRVGGDAMGGTADAATLAGYHIRPARKPIPTAETTVVESGATLAADATDAGRGGSVVVWADRATAFAGTITATGGPRGGDGGFVETSGRQTLAATGMVRTGAVNGAAGVWLLDPADITISTGGSTTPIGGTHAPTGSVSVIHPSVIADALAANSSVEITTSAGSGGTGTITVSDAITKTSGGNSTLTLKASRDVIVNADITSTAGTLGLVLNAHAENDTAPGRVRISGATIDTNGGSLTIGGGLNPATTAAIGLGSITGEANRGVSLSGATITTGAGAIRIAGDGGSDGANGSNRGIETSGTTITTTSGAITLIGRGSHANGTGNTGIVVGSGTTVQSTSGAISLDGSGGSNTGGLFSDYGIQIASGAHILSSGTAPISLRGINPNTSLRGIWADSTAQIGGAAATGAITLEADELTLDSTASVQGHGDLTLRPADLSASVTVGGSTGSFPLTAATLAALQDGFSMIHIGRADGSGTITVATAAFKDAVTIGNGDPSGKILVSGALSTGSGTEAGTITLQAGDSVTLQSGSSITTQNRAVVLNAARSGAGAVVLTSAAITTNGGALTMGGGVPSSGDTPTGPAVGTATNPAGIGIAGSTILTGGGAITLRGTGYTGLTNSHGIALTGTTALNAGTGAILLDGVARSGAGTQSGVLIDAQSGTLTLTSAAPSGTAISITGTASTGNSTSAWGLRLLGNATVQATGGGAISLSGTAGTSSDSNVAGIGTENTGAGSPKVQSLTGAITLTGTAGTGPGATGLTLSGSTRIGKGALTGTASADITLTADSMVLARTGSPEIQSGGTLTIAPLTASTTIGLGSGAGSLSLTSASLAVLKDGFSAITIGRADGTGAITTGGALTFSDTLHLRSPGGGIAIGGTLDTGLNTLTLETSGTATQSAAIRAAALRLLGGGGTHTLTDAGNNVLTLAGNTGTVTYRDSDGLMIGTVGGTAGLTVNGTTLSLTTGGTLEQTAALTGVGQLTIAAGGDILLAGSGASNTVSRLGAITRGGAFRFENAGTGLLVDGAIGTDTLNGDISIRTAGDLTLNGATAMAVSGTGSIALSAAGAFRNGAGAGVFTLGTGRWLIYSADDTQITTGGLSGGTLYGRTWTGDPPSSITAPGNQFLFANTPSPPVPPPPPPPPPPQPPVSPPTTDPPVTQPPVTDPPVTDPPVTQPPVTQPPVTQPPVSPPTPDPPVATHPPAPPPPPVTAGTTTTTVPGTLSTAVERVLHTVQGAPPPVQPPAPPLGPPHSPVPVAQAPFQGPPHNTPASVALASGGTAVFTTAATAARREGATLAQPGPEVLAAPRVQAAAATVAQAAANGNLAAAVQTVAAGRLTVEEQKAVFQNVPAAAIVSGLKASPDPVARRVGAALETVAATGQPAYAEVKKALKDAGADADTARTYLVMTQRVEREQRTQTFSGALSELIRDPAAYDLFRRADGPAAPPRIARFSAGRTRGTGVTLRGIVEGSEGVAEARVNGRWVFIDENGQFRTSIPVDPGETQATLTIVDDKGQKTEQVITIAADTAATGAEPAPVKPRRIALMIAVDTYANPGIPTLGTPPADVAAVGRALSETLGYETRVLRNPGKMEIAAALRALGREVNEQDKVVVYYAGHGYEITETGTGYWLPADAGTDSARNWLSNNDIARFLSRMPAKHVMLVSDSCYSGSFTKEQKVDAAALKALTRDELRQRRSVMAMSSGGDEPVADGEVNSPFAAALLTRIGGLPSDAEGYNLFLQVREDVTREVPQTPQYGVVRTAGYDQGGDYLLELNRQSKIQPKQTGPAVH
ncbi:filamentous hemagglutinin family protein [Azospirillum fermentarium]|uniref:two-partner secretion domain-containing protein n=1 Tax=Azospirillum fermentarium TaxID=1233114 RepID=UPI0022267FC0|nr:filamentous hemagglutinin N-terminal domain-containing protein [Azospirillum fermentarium]MCW2246188.1 filamentous hemagglutinin family protein [Azospirillum fermentarium]